ncbi:hypothetical protein SADUNF_Sadunf10G0074600 [Salix dunnii]|uniref:Retrotransposon Copia-like N-terminal domain-containing protein n=1 Tax=Salix dunnii TaxID=1413687 RepID=A0A835MUH0_9ROSI|nr:hypothetical protein SADUNF_Sadunf10G0074600 [Salix dunnii]
MVVHSSLVTKYQKAFNSFMVSEHTLAHAFIDPMSITINSSFSVAFHLPAQIIFIKLDSTNFLAWNAQLLPLFRSYGFMGIVNGSEPSPPQFNSTKHKNQGTLNSSYVVWQYKDQTILGWIISSLSLVVVSTIYGLETSRLAWQALGACFIAPSTSRISLITGKLQSLQQGSMQCQSFLNVVKSLADKLSVIKINIFYNGVSNVEESLTLKMLLQKSLALAQTLKIM